MWSSHHTLDNSAHCELFILIARETAPREVAHLVDGAVVFARAVWARKHWLIRLWVLLHGRHNRLLESDMLGQLGFLLLILFFLSAAAAQRTEIILVLLENCFQASTVSDLALSWHTRLKPNLQGLILKLLFLLKSVKFFLKFSDFS